MLTESESHYDHLEEKSTSELLVGINSEDQKVTSAVKLVIPKIEKLVDQIVIRMVDGGRLFYIGAGTSGRLGIVDASECPPTFGVSDGLVIGLIAGGDQAIRKAVEHAEDNPEQGWQDLQAFNISEKDTLIGIAASGKTPYVVGAVKQASQFGILTGAITCNEQTPLASASKHPIEVLVGPEFITGSTRMKAGTAQKMVLNMISTTVMIRLGRVKGNKMVDMQLTNQKLHERAVQMITSYLHVSREEASKLLTKHQSVRKVLDNFS
jgi:N-acetylmuramic acid 6-phosphate etherase